MQARRQSKTSATEISDLTIALDEHALVAVTDAEGKIISVNDRFCAISRYSREQLLGQDHRIINSGYHSREFMRDLWTTIASGKVWKGEFKNKARDGTFYWVDNTIVPFLNDRGTPRKFISIAVDATTRKTAESQLLRINTELEQRIARYAADLKQANQEMEAFSHSISHDLRAPLRAIGGFSRILEKELVLSAEAQQTFDRIRSNVARMGQLIDGLLDYSSLNWVPVVKKKIAPAPFIDDAFKQLHSKTENRRVVFEMSELPECNADAGLLKQAFSNLLSNALKYTRGRDPAVIKVGWHDQGGQRLYFIQDNGAGFDMTYASRLFRLFQRLHTAEEFEGAGVGLAIVQRIIHRHGGKIWAEARVNHGATFYFTIPD